MKRVLVTGATGFVGRHCLQPLLDLGYAVHAPTIDAVQGLPADVHWHRTDLLDAEAVAHLVRTVAPTHCLHLAWYAQPGEYWTSRRNLAWCRATLVLLERLAELGPVRMVGAGTCAEYDWETPDGVCREGLTAERPRTLYGSCKKAMHDVCMGLDRQDDLRAAWGRLFFLYGPHEHPQRLVPAVIRALLEGREAACTSGTQVRDFLHVADAAAALVALLDSDVRGAVNLASGHAVPVRDVVLRIGAQLRRPELIRLGARPTPPGEPPALTADVSRLRQEVRWHGARPLADGLQETIHWWQQRVAVSGSPPA